MRELLIKLMNTITQARVTRVSADTERYPSAQISSGKKVSVTTRLLPYPLIGNPTSDALGVKFNLQGQEQNSATIFHDPKARLKGLAEGEGGIHNAATGSYILLTENGDIKMVSLNDLVAQITGDVLNTIAGSLTNTVTGDMTDTVTGDIIQTAANLSSTISGTALIQAPTINLTGNTTVSGAFGCNGASAQTVYSLGNAATNAGETQTLANNIRLALIANGIGTT